MYPGEFDDMFRKISKIFTLETLAVELDLKGNFPKRTPKEPLWDCIDSLHHEEYIDIGNSKYFPCKFFFKKPVRILFFILISEFETRLFRIHERLGKDISELNDKNMNDLIKELLDPKIMESQEEYSSRAEFKEDLKAISAFRNVIMHTNKKLELTIEPDIVFQRKKQMQRSLIALQQISDKLKTN